VSFLNSGPPRVVVFERLYFPNIFFFLGVCRLSALAIRHLAVFHAPLFLLTIQYSWKTGDHYCPSRSVVFIRARCRLEFRFSLVPTPRPSFRLLIPLFGLALSPQALIPVCNVIRLFLDFVCFYQCRTRTIISFFRILGTGDNIFTQGLSFTGKGIGLSS